MNDQVEDKTSLGCFPWRRHSSAMQQANQRGRGSTRKKPKIERLVGFSLLLILRYAIPRAQSLESCNVDELDVNDELYPPPRVECQQGFFNLDLGSCICFHGWTGKVCDVCLNEPCMKKAKITLIQPQRAFLNSTPLINFIGHGFPRTVENNYHCLFNDTKTSGKWINSTQVDCLRPKNLIANEPYEVALVPVALYRIIRYYEHAFFDFYEPCAPSNCTGACVQSICICKQGKTGSNCTDTLQPLSIQCSENQTQVYNATEFQPFTALVAANNAQKPFLLNSSVPEIHINRLEGLLAWEKPIGSSQPQTVDYQVKRENCTDYFHAIINVPSIYEPQVTSVTKHKTTNLHRIAGYIKFNAIAKEIAQNNLPLVLKIFEGDQLIEQFKIQSTRRFFAYDIYPYYPHTTNNRHEYFIFAEHPSPSTNSTPGLSFTNCVINAQYPQTLTFDGDSLQINYNLTSDDCLCGEWSVKVLWPRELIRIRSQEISGPPKNPNIRIIISLDPSVEMHYEKMFVAIGCDSSASYTATHNLAYKTRSLTKVYPEQIKIFADPLKATSTFVEINVELTSLHAEAQTSGLEPFFLVMPPILRQVSNDITKASYLFGIQRTQESLLEGILNYPTSEKPLFSIPYRLEWSDWEPAYFLSLHLVCSSFVKQGEYVELKVLSSTKTSVFTKAVLINTITRIQLPERGVYEFSIVSESFLSITETIGVISLNTTMELMLHQRPSKYLALNDGLVEFVNSGIMPSRPELVVEPSVITSLQKSIWLNFIYKTGPQNSMAMVRAGSISNGPYQITNLPVNIAIAVESGYRHLIAISSNVEHKNNTVHVLKIPYVYTIPGVSKDFTDTASLILDFRSKNNQVTHFEPSEEIVTRSTKIYNDCKTQILEQCRPKFRRVDLCSSLWTEHLNSRLPSMQSFVNTFLYKRNCANNGLQQAEITDILRCVISANIGSCQIEYQITNEMLECTQKSPSLFAKANLYNQMAQKLNVSRFDVCRFVNLFYKQLYYLNLLIPSDAIFHDYENFDAFIETISDDSDLSGFITLAESTRFQSNSDELLFLSNWNRLHDELKFKNLSEKVPLRPTNASVLDVFSVFLNTIAKLNYLSNQIGNNTTPPALLNDLLIHMLAENGKKSTVIMNANLNIEPKCLRESNQFHVYLQLNNPTTDVKIDKIELRIRFKGVNSDLVTYRLKSTLYNGQKSSLNFLKLMPEQNLTVQWAVVPTFGFRLTEKLIQTAVVGINFEANGKPKWQEVQSNVLQIEPAETLRTIALLYPNVTNKDEAGLNPFSVQISVMNIGYSTIKQVRLINLLPDITSTESNDPIEFKLDSVQIEEYESTNMLNINLGDMRSGETRQVLVNFSTRDRMGFLRGLEFTPVSSTRLLDSYSGRQFYVRKQIQSDSFLISEVSGMYQLYYFQSNYSNLIPLNSVFFTQEESIQQSDNCFTSVVQAFRLADESKKFDSPLVATSHWPKNINKSNQLMAIFQVFPNFDVIQRIVAPESIWIAESSNEQREINFIDLSPFTSASEIFYELVFADTECNTKFSFLQHHYNIPSPPEALFKYSIVAQIQAIVPENTKPINGHVEYKLLSTESDLPFAVLAENGAIIFMNATSVDDKPHCAVLVAEDGDGHLTNATIQLGGRRRIECKQPEPNSTLFQHVLGGAHNLPFDYNEAITEFLNNARLTNPNQFLPMETTTEQPGDDWTPEKSEDIIATPQSTLQSIATTTEEPIHEPDVTLTNIQMPSTTIHSVSPDSHVSEQTTLMSTTSVSVEVANALPTSPSVTTKHPNSSVSVNLLTMTKVPTTSALPIMSGSSISKNNSYNLDPQFGDKGMTNAELIDMACKNRNQKPMLQVLCDLAKSVFRTHA